MLAPEIASSAPSPLGHASCIRTSSRLDGIVLPRLQADLVSGLPLTVGPLDNPSLCVWTDYISFPACHLLSFPLLQALKLQVPKEEVININWDREVHAWECYDSQSNTQDRNCLHWIRRHLFSVWCLCRQGNSLRRRQRRVAKQTNMVPHNEYIDEPLWK